MSASIRTAALLAAVAQQPIAPEMRKALAALSQLLSEVGARAAQIDDERLNELMARLGIYAVPESDRVALLQWRKQHPMPPAAEIARLRRSCIVKRYLSLRGQIAGKVFSPAKAALMKKLNAKGTEVRKAGHARAKKARQDAAATAT